MRKAAVVLSLFLLAPFASAERIDSELTATVSTGASPWELSFEITSEDDGAEHNIVWENKTGFTIENTQESWALDSGDTLVWRYTITETQEGTEGTFSFDFTLLVNDAAAETGTLTLTIKEGGGSLADKGREAIEDKVPEGLPVPGVGPVLMLASLAAITLLARRK